MFAFFCFHILILICDVSGTASEEVGEGEGDIDNDVAAGFGVVVVVGVVVGFINSFFSYFCRM